MPDNVECCAVALALKESLGTDFEIKVLAEDFIITNKEVEIKNHIASPEKKQEVVNFIQDFDSMWKDGKILSELKPIEFELEIG